MATQKKTFYKVHWLIGRDVWYADVLKKMVLDSVSAYQFDVFTYTDISKFPVCCDFLGY